jgi:hypothetical protein
VQETRFQRASLRWDTKSLVNAEEITTEKLEAFDVIITGIRAYNVLPLLASKQKILLDFVKSGTMIVQYTPDSSIPADIAPYPLKISRDRVTDENAAVRFFSS